MIISDVLPNTMRKRRRNDFENKSEAFNLQVNDANSTVKATSGCSQIKDAHQCQDDANCNCFWEDRPQIIGHMAPIALLYPGYGVFQDIIKGRYPVPEELRCSYEEIECMIDVFATAMRAYYPSELERQKNIGPILNQLLSLCHGNYSYIESKPIGTMSSDNPLNTTEIAIEYRNEIGVGHSLPDRQVLSYMAHAHRKAIKSHPSIYRGFRVPTLGIIVIGAEVYINDI
jgi:hypothetical protein